MQAQLANHALVEPFLRFWKSSVVVVDGLSLVCVAFMPLHLNFSWGAGWWRK
jgi:hypothetical protein